MFSNWSDSTIYIFLLEKKPMEARKARKLLLKIHVETRFFFAGVQSPCGSEFQALLRVSIWLQNAYSPVFSLTNHNTIAKPENAICKMHRAIILASCTICAFFVGCSQLYTYTRFVAKSETCKMLILLGAIWFYFCFYFLLFCLKSLLSESKSNILLEIFSSVQ